MISVCMATYNGERHIKEQLSSILRQLSADDEVIISDDHSTDNTLKIIENLRDPRIKVILNTPVNAKHSDSLVSKVTRNFENALRMAKGDYIFLSDQDDVWSDDKIKVTMRYLEKWDLIVSDFRIIDSNGIIIKEEGTICDIRLQKYKNLFGRAPFHGGCMAFSSKILTRALPFPTHLQSHDRWIGFVASFFYSVKKIDNKLILYRRTDSNVSTSTTRKSPNSLYYRICTRLYYAWHLLKRSQWK